VGVISFFLYNIKKKKKKAILNLESLFFMS
jgi:hypothetical protein